MIFWIFAKVYGMRERIVPPDPWFRSLMSVVTLEAGLIVGAALLLGGLVIPSSAALLLGFQIIYSAFFVSIPEIRASRPAEATVPDRSAQAA
jgi:hypothetical protein